MSNLLSTGALALTLAIAAVAIGKSGTVIETAPSASARVSVPDGGQDQFIAALTNYAHMKGLVANPSVLPGPPRTLHTLIIVTPKENELQIINANTENKFEVSIMIFHREERWQPYWRDFRAYVSQRYKWEDVP